MQSVIPPYATPAGLRQLLWGFAPTLILEAALHHRVFDILDVAPLNLAELSRETGTSERGLRALVDGLVGMGFVKKDSTGQFHLAAVSRELLVSSKPDFQGGLLLRASSLLEPWLFLKEAVRTGRPVTPMNNREAGAERFRDSAKDLFHLNRRSAQALASAIRPAVPELGSFKVLDVGAGSGVWGISLAERFPTVTITAIDWEDVLPAAEEMAATRKVLDRFTFIGGDFHDVDLGTGHSLAILGHILHGEGEHKSRALLTRVFAALRPGGAIAIAEFLVNAERTEPLLGLIFALSMLLNTDEGSTFSSTEINGWLLDAGFVEPRLLEVPGPSPLILANKPAN